MEKMMIKLKSILTEIESDQYEIVTGLEFKRKYLTTNSRKGDMIWTAFDDNIMGLRLKSRLGPGLWNIMSVTQDCTDYYESDERYRGTTNTCNILNPAKIVIIPDSQKFNGNELKSIAEKNDAHAVYNPNEGKGGIPYLGLIYFDGTYFR